LGGERFGKLRAFEKSEVFLALDQGGRASGLNKSHFLYTYNVETPKTIKIRNST